MRRVIARIPVDVDRETGRLELYGPNADLSGVETSAPVSRAVAHPWHDEPRWHGQAHHCYPHHSLVERAGFHGARHHSQAHHGELLVAPVAATREYEYGVLPHGAKAADEMGNESASMTTASVLVVDSPAAPLRAVLSRPAGRFRVTLTEWPDG